MTQISEGPPSKHRCVIVAQSCPALRPPWTRAHEAPLFMEFCIQEYWNGLPFASPSNRRSGCFTVSLNLLTSFLSGDIPGFLNVHKLPSDHVLSRSDLKKILIYMYAHPLLAYAFYVKGFTTLPLKIFCDYICHFIKCISKLF